MKTIAQIQSPHSAWRAPSLRGRIAFLAATVVVLLLITLCILLWVIRSSQANAVARSQKHLAAAARSMANAYQSRPDRSVSLARMDLLPPPRPDEGPKLSPPLAPPPPRPRPPGGGPDPATEQALAATTSRVLQDETGIEGGFFRAADQRLVGYAFPTHEGPGDPRAMPARETPNIVNVAMAAVTRRQLQQDQFYGTHDVVLFIAVPICETQSCADGPVGAAWLMQRLPGAEAERKRTLLWSAFGFGLVACVTVILAFLVLREVGEGTQAVLDRLMWMESDLSHQQHPASVRLAEFHRVLDGLDRLGDTLRGQMDRERDLQARVRQNERLVAVGQMAAVVAHELRNPLATIRLRAQMTRRRTPEEMTAQASAVILSEVDRLDAIIERLLEFSRPIRVHPRSIDLSALLAAATQRWAQRYPDLNIRCTGKANVCAIADPSRLQQVVDNLIENAVHQLIEAKTANPDIQVDCGESGENTSVTIADNGGGFTPEALKNATEPFFTTRSKGTGLGLAITQEIIQLFGGTLTLTNERKGALVRIEIPKGENC